MVHLDPQDTHSLTDFQRNTKAHLKRLKSTGRPELLTVNGKAEAIVLSPETYQQLSELAHEAELIRGLREALAQMERGDAVSLAVFDKRFRGKHGIPS